MLVRVLSVGLLVPIKRLPSKLKVTFARTCYGVLTFYVSNRFMLIKNHDKSNLTIISPAFNMGRARSTHGGEEGAYGVFGGET